MELQGQTQMSILFRFPDRAAVIDFVSGCKYRGGVEVLLLLLSHTLTHTHVMELGLWDYCTNKPQPVTDGMIQCSYHAVSSKEKKEENYIWTVQETFF